MNSKVSAAGDPDTLSRDARARQLQGHHALRCWMRGYPELFSTKVQVDCFIAIALLTTHDDTIPSLNSLYRSLSYAENSVRSYVRSLAVGGWISLVRSPCGDRRSTGLRLEGPLLQVQDEYYALLEKIGKDAPDTAVDVGDADASRFLPARELVSP